MRLLHGADGDLDDEGEWVSLQFDDKVVTVLRSTLTRQPGTLFEALFREGSPTRATVARNVTHPARPFLFDRSPQYVLPLINFLRSGELVIDPGVNARGVYLEAQYWGMDDAVALLDGTTAPLVAPPKPDELAAATVAPPPRVQYTRGDVERALMSTTTEARLRFAGMCFDGADLSDLDLSNVDFRRAKLDGADLSRCVLTGALMDHCSARGAVLRNATLRLVHASHADFCDAILDGASACGADFTGSLFVAAQLRTVDLAGATLEGCNLTNSVLAGAQIKGANLRRAVLLGVDRQGTSLTMGGVIA